MLELCKVDGCPNEAGLRGVCRPHLRSELNDRIYTDDDGVVREHCPQGHAYTEDNIRWETSARKGGKRRRCKKCLKAKAQRQAQAKKELPPEPPAPYRPDDPTLMKAIFDFNEAREYIAGKCLGREDEWMGWVFDESKPQPTAEEADEMCSGCPLLQACGNYAVAAREQWGVWGGLSIANGRVQEYTDN